MIAQILLIFAFAILFTPKSAASGVASPALPDNHAEIISSEGAALVIEFDNSDLFSEERVQDGDRLSAFQIEGEGAYWEYGKPVLPVVSRFVVVPPGAGLELVVRPGEVRIVEDASPPPICRDGAPEGMVLQPFEYPEGVFPPQYVEMSEPIVIRGVRLVQVKTYPVQYDAEQSIYIIRDRIQAEIRFTDDEPVNPVLNPVRRNRSPQFLKYIREFAINGDEVGRDDPDRNQEPEYVGHYLIVTNEACLEFAVPFIEWRRKSGYKVDILSLNSGQAGNSNTVKTQIQNRYDAYVDNGEDPFDNILLIGDRSAYNYTAAAAWTLIPFQGNSTWGNVYRADYLFACLDGGNNDRHPDVGISRWHTGNRNLMEAIVGRTLAYEAMPYMEDTSWFTRGGNYSQHWGNSPESAWHITIHTNARWGEQVLKYLGFDPVYFYEQYQHDRQGNMIGPVIEDWLNEGVNVMVGRAENYYWDGAGAGNGNFDRDIDDNVIFPINICHSGHGEWCAEAMTRNGSGNHLKGPVAMTYGWGNPQYTAPITASWLECVNAMMLKDMPLGWARVYGITAIENYFGGGESHVLSNKTEFDCFGDPGIQPWIGVPDRYDISHPAAITPSARYVEVFVSDPDNDDAPVEGAQVTLYAPGDMPDPDDDDYAGYDGMFMVTKKSAADGMARFVFPDGMEFEPGAIYVTLSGRNILPVFADIEIEIPEAAIELDGYELTEVEGNDDGDLNPGEVFTLSIAAVNVGNGGALDDVTAVVSSRSPWVEIAENEVTFGELDAGESTGGEGEVVISLDPALPDGSVRPDSKPVIIIDFSSGEQTWQSAVSLNPVAPNLRVLSIPGGNTIPDSLTEISIEIENIGRRRCAQSSVELISRGMGVSVLEPRRDYPAIGPGGSATPSGDRRFLVSGNELVVPGWQNEMMIIVTAEGGFIDTAYFSLQVSEPREAAPQGPDKYGYICFDDTDSDWEIAPEFDWLEISTEEEYDFEGVLFDFEGRSLENVGESIVLDLPFETQFYNHVYDKITVCTNGYIAMGDQGRITNFQNWPLDQAIGGGMGMVAPFWDRLKLVDGSGIYWYHNDEESYIIIEWYKLRHFQGGNQDLTFQVILYDRDIWITETGDQHILFQYNSILQVAGQQEGTPWSKNIPFASVGISSPDGTTGINYTFNNVYPVTSARLEDQRAIKFVTSTVYRTGFVYGVVTDLETDEPVEASVYDSHGFITFCDSTGYYRLEILADQMTYITAHAQGYNDSTVYDILVAEDDSTEQDFQLLHPEFNPNRWELFSVLDPGLETELGFTMTNTGNGPLNWTVERRLIGDANAVPWEFRRSYPVGNIVNDTRIGGLLFIENKFFVSGNNDNFPLIYIFDREGALIDSFAQPVENHRHGIKDMAWDGELIWGAVENRVYGFTTEGEVLHEWEVEYNPTTVITWDPDRELFWLSATTTDIVAYTAEGEKIDSLEISRHDMRMYGFAYWEEDPEDHPLYVFHRDRFTGLPTVHKIDPETGDTIRVAVLGDENSGTPLGAFLTNQYDVYSWVFMGAMNAPPVEGGDNLSIWQMEARKDWFQVDIMGIEGREAAAAGTLQTEESSEFILTLNSTDLPETTFVSELFFLHNADSGRAHIMIQLDVIGPTPPTDFDLVLPADRDTLDNTEVQFAWLPSYDPNDGEEVAYKLWVKVNDDSIGIATADTSMLIDLDTLWVDRATDVPVYWWVEAVSGEDTTVSRSRFSFMVLLNDLDDPGIGMPVKYGFSSVYPNPFNSVTRISFGMDVSSHMRMSILDITGRETTLLCEGFRPRGYHSVTWDGADIPSGIYFIQLRSDSGTDVSKIILLR